MLLCILIISLLSIYGVNQAEMAVFLGSVLAVIGIALFAQWSILSNITSGVIIFFNYSVKIEVRIRIMENDYEIEGTISDIGLFFGTLKTSSTEYISIPNSVSLSKMIYTNRMNKRAYVLLLLGL